MRHGGKRHCVIHAMRSAEDDNSKGVYMHNLSEPDIQFGVLGNQERASLGVVGQVDERQHGAHDVLAMVVVEGEAVRVHLGTAGPCQASCSLHQG